MWTEKEIVSVLQYLDNKSILVIGATGFLGKSTDLDLSV